jgi:hypothetical protein
MLPYKLPGNTAPHPSKNKPLQGNLWRLLFLPWATYVKPLLAVKQWRNTDKGEINRKGLIFP